MQTKLQTKLREEDPRIRALKIIRKIRVTVMRNSLITFFLGLFLGILICMQDGKIFSFNFKVIFLFSLAFVISIITIVKEIKFLKTMQRTSNILNFIMEEFKYAIRFPIYANIPTILALIICMWSLIGLITYILAAVPLLISYVILMSLEDAMRMQLFI